MSGHTRVQEKCGLSGVKQLADWYSERHRIFPHPSCRSDSSRNIMLRVVQTDYLFSMWNLGLSLAISPSDLLQQAWRPALASECLAGLHQELLRHPVPLQLHCLLERGHIWVGSGAGFSLNFAPYGEVEHIPIWRGRQPHGPQPEDGKTGLASVLCLLAFVGWSRVLLEHIIPIWIVFILP